MSRMDDTQRWRCLFSVVHCTSGIWSSYVIVISDEQEQTKWMIVYITWLICYSCKQSMGMRTSNECFSTRRSLVNDSSVQREEHQRRRSRLVSSLSNPICFQGGQRGLFHLFNPFEAQWNISEYNKLERCMKLRITVIYTEKKLIDHIKSQLVLDWAFEYDAYWHRVH